MKSYRRIIFYCLAACLLLSNYSIQAQEEIEQKRLSYEEFFSIIIQAHPVARQAELLTERARQELRIARGNLDPTLNSKYAQKTLDNKRYYNLWDNSLRIPTWFGIDLNVGYERNVGTFVNNEKITPVQGLGYAGVVIPLGQGLIIDQRRSVIRQARILPELAEAERVSVINRLLLQAARDYWNWSYYYQRWNLHIRGYALATFRAESVKQRVMLGDLAAIDSVEANIEAQNRFQLMRESEIIYKNSALILSNYIWGEDDIPLEIPENIVPDMRGSEIIKITEDSLQELQSQAIELHPQLQNLNLRIKQLDIERQLRADRLKPKLNFEYNLLQRNFPATPDLSSGFFTNNYRYGINFSFPLFLRQERGQFALAKLRLQETNYTLQQSNREILNSIRIAYNDLVVIESLIDIQEQMVINMERLRDAEQRRFEAGESSVFLINTREMNLINARIRLQELIARYATARTTLQWATGRIL